MSGMFGEAIARSGHKSVEWYTPEWIFDALGLEFDLDPASPHDHETHVPATTKYTNSTMVSASPGSGGSG